MFSFFVANNGRTTVTECESLIVFTCLTYRNYVQHFPNGPVHEFYGLKASQMSKVHDSSHDRATHMLKNQESSGPEFQRYSGPQLSQQKN